MPPVSTAPRPLRFLIVGIWNTIVGYGTFVALVALTRKLEVSYLLASGGAQVVGIVNAYFCHRAFTWQEGDRSFAGFLRFNVVYWVIFAVNVPLLILLVSGLGLLPEVAQGLLIFGNAATSYIVHGKWSFRRRAPAGDAPELPRSSAFPADPGEEQVSPALTGRGHELL